jgi:hypothetical protein
MNLQKFAGALLVVVGLLLPVQGASAQAACTFTLGFQTLRNLTGPAVVGECLENEWFNPGNAQQHTTGGLMVWRKADNWTAFTDGYRTWLNGPSGLQVRLNTERFPWEAPSPWTMQLLRAEQVTNSQQPNLKLAVFVVAIRNLTGNTILLNQDDLALIDTQGRTYLPSLGPSCRSGSAVLSYIPSGALAPRFEDRVTVGYTLQQGVVPAALRLRDGETISLPNVPFSNAYFIEPCGGG